MSNLLTANPYALQTLMSETIFATQDSVIEVSEQVQEPVRLYKKTPPPAEPWAAPAEEFIFQGMKESGILFILRYAQYPYFSPQAEEAFVKTIGALQLTPENVAVVNLANAHNPNDFKRIMAFFEPQKIILLGVEPISLQLPLIPHNSYMRGKKATVFNTYSFEEMFADIDKKRAFWAEFKQLISA